MALTKIKSPGIDTNIDIAGTLDVTNAATFDSTGAFAGNVQTGGDPNDGTDPGVKLLTTGLVQAARNSSSGTSAVWTGYTEGTATPTSRINANGSATFYSSFNIKAPDGGSRYLLEAIDAQGAQLSLYDSSDAQNTKISAHAAYPTFFGTNVGIGTTSPDMILDVTGTVTAGGGTDQDLQQWNIGSDNVKAEIKYDDTSATRGYIFGTSTQHDLALQTNNTDRLHIAHDGNVGIGGAITDNYGTGHRVVQIHSGTTANTYLALTNTTTGDQGADNGLNLVQAGVNAYINNRSAGKLTFSTDDNERVCISSAGVMSVANGIELGSGLDATAANTLDDYEEGTFTPAFDTFNSSSTVSHTDQSGRYTKIGDVVYFSVKVLCTVSSWGNGEWKITGLPFTCWSGYNNPPVMSAKVAWKEAGGTTVYKEMYKDFRADHWWNQAQVFFVDISNQGDWRPTTATDLQWINVTMHGVYVTN